MDYRRDEPPVEVSGGTGPADDPHRCPFQRYGASKEACFELTTVYQHNMRGCCGTHDSRDFEPCNSILRRCVKCLEEGKGVKAQVVADIKKGLCVAHAEANSSLPVFVEPEPLRIVRKKITVGALRPVAETVRVVRPPPRVVKERHRNPSIKRSVKMAFLTEARQFFGRRPMSVGLLVDKALTLMEEKGISIERSSLYKFASGGLTSNERINLALIEKSKYNRRVHTADG